MYGIYDLSGGLMERVAGYVANDDERLEAYGLSFAWDGSKSITQSTKYAKVYAHDSTYDNVDLSSDVLADAQEANYKKNPLVYGDAICETSTAGTGSTSWYGDYSIFCGLNFPLLARGCPYYDGSKGGLLAFWRDNGKDASHAGFRPVVVVE